MSLAFVQNQAVLEGVSFCSLAEKYGTPLYVYSNALLEQKIKDLTQAFAKPRFQICYAVKTNSNLSILRKIFSAGLGADVVSVGELERALHAGVDPKQMMFSGVGKRDDEIKRALELGIKSLNVESRAEFLRVERMAQETGQRARVVLRVNPNIDAKTHPKISTGIFSSKFGIIEEEARELLYYAQTSASVRIVGLSCHLGSQITSIAPYRDAAQRMNLLGEVCCDLGHPLEFIDMGGGFGIRYFDEELPSFSELAAVMNEEIRFKDIELVIEPGRSLVGESGFLLTRAILQKSTPERNFLVVDAAMNDLIRPTLYDAYHEIMAVHQSSGTGKVVDVVGPICETGDILGVSRFLDVSEPEGLYLIKNCGAYSAVMASQYNSRPRCAEVLVEDKTSRLIRRRETLNEIWRLEEEDALT